MLWGYMGEVNSLVSWSLTSLFSTNMAISESNMEEILLLNKFFFRLSIHALVAKI